MPESPVPSRRIISVRIDATNSRDAVGRIAAWARRGEGRSVYAANVHVVMEAYDNPGFAEAVNFADLVTPDGMPLVWVLRLLGITKASRVYGPDLTLHVCEAAEREKIPVALYGSTPECLNDFRDFLHSRYPGLEIACAISPPFRAPTPEEDDEHVMKIIESGARILFVGLGCPKQETWIYEHRGRLSLVMLGVGVAFDFHAGRTRQAPGWIMRIGLEWLFRLCVEPKRLWKRYFKHNPRFVFLFLKQMAADYIGRK